MNLTLLVKKQTDPGISEELDFSQFPVLLGREDSNQVILPDPFKIISRKHAQIINTEGILQLIDLNSANATYLNDKRIDPAEENPLKTGDNIKIGDYIIEVVSIKTSEKPHFTGIDDDQKTMVFSNPYKEELSSVAEILKRIADKYESDNSPIKSDAFRFSMLQTFRDFGNNEVNKTFAEFFSDNFLEKEFPAKNKPGISTGFNISEQPKIKEAHSISQPAIHTAGTMQEYSFNSHFSSVLDLLLDTFSKLIQGFLQFRQEFFGVTVFYVMPTASLKEFKEYLFNPAISPDEEKKRISLLKEEVQKILTHQIGLLEGYKSCAMDGSKLLLQSIDPGFIEAKLEKKNKNAGISKVIPFIKQSKILEAIKENYKKYVSDPYHVEKKFFRPSFIKGYQKRQSAKPQDDF